MSERQMKEYQKNKNKIAILTRERLGIICCSPEEKKKNECRKRREEEKELLRPRSLCLLLIHSLIYLFICLAVGEEAKLLSVILPSFWNKRSPGGRRAAAD